jgi:hypothetical protein
LATSWSSPSLIALARSSPDPAQHHRPAAGAGLRLGRELVRHVGRLGEANAAGLEEEARWGWRRWLVWGLRQNLGTYRSATGIRLRARGRHLEKTGITRRPIFAYTVDRFEAPVFERPAPPQRGVSLVDFAYLRGNWLSSRYPAPPCSGRRGRHRTKSRHLHEDKVGPRYLRSKRD